MMRFRDIDGHESHILVAFKSTYTPKFFTISALRLSGLWPMCFTALKRQNNVAAVFCDNAAAKFYSEPPARQKIIRYIISS